MSDDNLLIGTVKRQVELPQFLQGTSHKLTPFVSSGQNMAGMQAVVSSGVGATSKNFTFSRMSKEDMSVVNDLRNGVHGTGPFYWYDPFAINLLPTPLSVPLWQTLAPQYCFDTGASTRRIRVDVPDNDIVLPVEGVRLEFSTTAEPQRQKFTFLVPKDKDLAVGIKGNTSGDTHFLLTSQKGRTTRLDLSSDLSKVIDNYIPTDGSQVFTLELVGSDPVILFGLTLSVVNHGANDIWWTNHRRGNVFRSGNGMVGAEFTDDDFEWTEYTVDAPWGIKHTGFTLVETEWSSN